MKGLKIALPVITVCMVCIIWGHSMMPGAASSSESGYITELINRIFGEGIISEHLIRKLAHFTEYMILGIICYLDFALYGKCGLKYIMLPLYICLFIAVADESIQLFTVGRNGMLLDVWIDHFGSLTGTMCSYIINRFIKRS